MLIVRQRIRTNGSYGESFCRYPTTKHLLAFKKTKANTRRVRRHSQRESWIRYVSSLTSSTSSKKLWKKVKAANGFYREFSFPILQTSDSVFSSPDEIANILWVKLFRMYPVQPLTILVFLRLSGVQKVPL
ncbi:putative RNA-directed DNA polymerase from transposon X-element [Trichonephila clavipes]|nr:putative RNA-directed DNA polymerase from transposon X-element [Trichonephila clavipes]